MTIEKITQENTLTLNLEGWLDTQTAPQLESAISEIPDDCEKLTLDFEKLEYISSAGLRQIVAAHKKMKGNMFIMNVPSSIMDIFKMAGFDKRLNIL